MKSNYPNIPSLKTLEAFESVARLSSVSVAARELCVSTSAISLQIKKLESELGKKLLEKSGRGISLTSDGATFYIEVKDILSTLDQRLSVIRSGFDNNELTIQTYVMPSIKWLNMKLIDYTDNHENIKLKITMPGYDHFNSKHADLAFILERDPQNIENEFRWIKVFPHEITPFCTPDLLKRFGIEDCSSPEEITKLPIISTTRDEEDWQRWFNEFVPGHRFKPYLTTGDKMTAIELAAHDKGVVLMNSPFVYRELASGELCKPFDCTIHLGEWGFIFKRGNKKEALIKDVISHISGVFFDS
ncbi:LysR family transcriptional regulator [Photobacterium obscurum]|uniref:LysR family transcriptional regulator n=1 Tax=Photobacterium obscurum TaxID=2829490 RepID=UPI002242E2FC|nr:LysR family transcriptional regulator [Photobacterium obscurum]